MKISLCIVALLESIRAKAKAKLEPVSAQELERTKVALEKHQRSYWTQRITAHPSVSTKSFSDNTSGLDSVAEPTSALWLVTADYDETQDVVPKECNDLRNVTVTCTRLSIVPRATQEIKAERTLSDRNKHPTSVSVASHDETADISGVVAVSHTPSRPLPQLPKDYPRELLDDQHLLIADLYASIILPEKPMSRPSKKAMFSAKRNSRVDTLSRISEESRATDDATDQQCLDHEAHKSRKFVPLQAATQTASMSRTASPQKGTFFLSRKRKTRNGHRPRSKRHGLLSIVLGPSGIRDKTEAPAALPNALQPGLSQVTQSVLTQIISYLPIPDLWTGARLVSKAWKAASEQSAYSLQYVDRFCSTYLREVQLGNVFWDPAKTRIKDDGTVSDIYCTTQCICVCGSQVTLLVQPSYFYQSATLVTSDVEGGQMLFMSKTRWARTKGNMINKTRMAIVLDIAKTYTLLSQA